MLLTFQQILAKAAAMVEVIGAMSADELEAPVNDCFGQGYNRVRQAILNVEPNLQTWLP